MNSNNEKKLVNKYVHIANINGNNGTNYDWNEKIKIGFIPTKIKFGKYIWMDDTTTPTTLTYTAKLYTNMVPFGYVGIISDSHGQEYLDQEFPVDNFRDNTYNFKISSCNTNVIITGNDAGSTFSVEIIFERWQ